MKPNIQTLRKTESAVALLIPGPEMLNDMNYICEDFKIVAVNHHCNDLLDPDWMVCADKLGRVPEFDEVFHSMPVGSRICAHPEQSDYRIEGEWWYGFGSASLAFWFSCLIADKVYVCGADLYQSDKRFFNESQENPYQNKGLEWQLKAWAKAPIIAKKLNTEVVILSGPLKSLFNQ